MFSMIVTLAVDCAAACLICSPCFDMFTMPAKKHNKAALHITTVPKSNGAPKRAVAALNDSPTAAPTWALCASSTWAQILHPALSAASMAPPLWAVHSDSRAWCIVESRLGPDLSRTSLLPHRFRRDAAALFRVALEVAVSVTVWG